ncbi:hypothetical protein MP228_004467 [Amoeboaphelidium protococcarum]|nr:hypothetical protein MP228_004467 [Amoeboaphelidium protococcarum]
MSKSKRSKEEELETVEKAEQLVFNIDEELMSLVEYLEDVSRQLQRELQQGEATEESHSKLRSLLDRVTNLRQAIGNKAVDLAENVVDRVKDLWREARQLGSSTLRKSRHGTEEAVKEAGQKISNWSQVFSSSEFAEYFQSKPYFNAAEWQKYLSHSKYDPRYWREVVEEFVQQEVQPRLQSAEDRLFPYEPSRHLLSSSRLYRGHVKDPYIGMTCAALLFMYLLLLIKRSWKIRNQHLIFFGEHPVEERVAHGTGRKTQVIQPDVLIELNSVNHCVQTIATLAPMFLLCTIVMEMFEVGTKFVIILCSVFSASLFLYNSTILEHHGHNVLKTTYELILFGVATVAAIVTLLQSAQFYFA